jgi:hypothetical protein
MAGLTNQPVKVNAWHEQLAIYMIANPTATNKETAAYFKVSPVYIGIIKNSDAFKAYYSSRTDAVFDKVIDDIYGQTIALTSQALEKLNTKVATIGDSMSPQELLTIADTGLKRLGYGASKFTGPAVTVNNNISNTVVDRRDLEEARRKMSEVHGVSVSDITPVEPRRLAAPEIPAASEGEK